MKRTTLIIVAMLCGVALTAGTGPSTPPFGYQLPPGAPPLLNWYVTNPGQTTFFNVETYTRYGSEVRLGAESAAPDGIPIVFNVTKGAHKLVDPNDASKGWLTRWTIGYNHPDANDTLYIKVTASVIQDNAIFEGHDLRDNSVPVVLVTSRTVVIKPIMPDTPTFLYRVPPDLITNALRGWMEMYAKAQKHGTVEPSKPAQVLRWENQRPQ